MKILFLGSLYPSNRVEEIQHNSSFFDYPGNTLQNALVDGFDTHIDLNIVTAPNIKRYASIKFKGSKFSHNKVSEDVCLTEIDIPVIKELLLSRKYYKAIKAKTDIDAIIIYSTSFPALYAATLYKRQNPTVKIINIITDLPHYMSYNNSWLYDMFKSIGIKLYYKYSINIDGYILLAPKMIEKLPFKEKPWLQIEGIYNNNVNIKDTKKCKNKTILYTGTLSSRYGIIDLLDAFSLINDSDFNLIFCGKGDSVDEILKRGKHDKRIKYLGVLSREETLRKQKEATLLINPRKSSDDYTKYSFPSKTMEYMASGTPTLMTKLECLPQEYYSYLFFIEDETPNGIKDKIIDICQMSQNELLLFGKRASDFILEHKNAEAQTQKIVKFIMTLQK